MKIEWRHNVARTLERNVKSVRNMDNTSETWEAVFRHRNKAEMNDEANMRWVSGLSRRAEIMGHKVGVREARTCIRNSQWLPPRRRLYAGYPIFFGGKERGKSITNT